MMALHRRQYRGLKHDLFVYNIGERNMHYSQWMNHLVDKGQPVPAPVLDSPGDSRETQAVKQLAEGMIKYDPSERCSAEWAYSEIRRIAGRFVYRSQHGVYKSYVIIFFESC